jgi:hypothetical protein
VSPESQTVPIDGTVFVGLDIDADSTVIGELAFVMSWTVREPEISGQLPFNVEVINGIPQALLFTSPTLGPSTVTANASWILNSDGFFVFKGQIHESGVIGHEYGFGMALNVTDANGVGFAVVHSGSIGPNLPFGDPDDSWHDVGFDQRIADSWTTIASSSTRARSGLNVDSRILVAILDALAVPAIAVLAVVVGSHIECNDPEVVVVGDDRGAGVGVRTKCRFK